MKHTLKIQRSARVGTLGSYSSRTKRIWIVLHGYGHLVPFFERKFRPLDEGDDFIILPEGPHRFYLNGTSGRVGASWMTKEDREVDISDNHHYLDEVYRHFIPSDCSAQVLVFGFSQGAATACRWAAVSEMPLQGLILWAGVFPPDLNLELSVTKLNGLNPILALGDDDEFIPMNRWKEELEEWRERGLEFKEMYFQGKHDIPKDSLRNLISMI